MSVVSLFTVLRMSHDSEQSRRIWERAEKYQEETAFANRVARLLTELENERGLDDPLVSECNRIMMRGGSEQSALNARFRRIHDLIAEREPDLLSRMPK